MKDKRNAAGLEGALISEFKNRTGPERASFVFAVDNEIALLRNDILPAYEAASVTPDTLDRLIRASKAFHKIIDQLRKRGGRDASDRLELAYGAQARRARASDGGVRIGKEALSELFVAGKVSQRALDAAVRARRGLKRPSTSKAIDKFVEDVAVEYSKSFGKRPSYSKTGTFAKLLPLILRRAGLEKPIRETRLRRILEGARFPIARG